MLDAMRCGPSKRDEQSQECVSRYHRRSKHADRDVSFGEWCPCSVSERGGVDSGANTDPKSGFV